MGQQSSSNRLAWIRRAIERLPPRISRNLLFVRAHHQIPHLRHPRTFNQKLNYRVLNDRRPLLTMASSKIESKRYAESLGVEGLKVPKTLWSGANTDDLDGLEIHTDWVIKPNHRSGLIRTGRAGAIKVSTLDIETEEWLSEREYRMSKLWGYKGVERCIFIEERIDAGSDSTFPDDIKFFVFAGSVEMIWVDSGRYSSQHTRTCFTPTWEVMPYDLGVPRAEWSPPPEGLADMIKVAEQLGEEFDFIRVDLYFESGVTIFGELTAYPFGGLTRWPNEIDDLLGRKWKLPPRHVLVEQSETRSLLNLLKRLKE